MGVEQILVPGSNCWRVERAHRAACLVEGEEYFAAFREAVQHARHRILILGWDIDSNLRLMRGKNGDGGPLGDFLNEIVSSRPELEANVLIWDFAMIYAIEREWLPVYRLGWKTHRRLHFHLDDEHPLGGSQHQKVVVIDDAVAFVGGMDLGKWRWDTSEHRPGDPRRVDAAGNAYLPYHDLQMVVDGPAAAALGLLARRRWESATGQSLPGPEPRGDPWPESVVPYWLEVDVGITRTEPRYRNRPQVREVERLYLDVIAAAGKYLYIENQYLTAKVIRDALAARLREPDGPEMVIVVPLKTGGWLEQNTMDVRRRALISHLRKADRYGRLRIVYPDVPGLAPDHISVHSKLMIVDDVFLRIGSSNLNNRSMGLDSECDLAIASAGDPHHSSGIIQLRNRLLAEHLGVGPDEVQAQFTTTGSLLATVDALSGKKRTLKELNDQSHLDPELEALVNSIDLVDPEAPVDPEELAERVIPEEQGRPASRGLWSVIVTLVVLFGLAAAWRWTPLGEWLDLESMLGALDAIQEHPWAPALVLAAYVIGGLLVIPITFMVAVTAIGFGPLWGFVYGLAGSLLSATVTFGIGHFMGRNTIRRVAGSRLNRLSQRLAERGLLAVITVRVLPVAPFTVVNLVAGVSHIRFKTYLLGTVLGMAPGIAGMVIFIDRLIAAIREPGFYNFAITIVVIIALVGVAVLLRRWVLRRRAAREETEAGD
ncbi:VTT domain-containing protein [Thiohalomonas denitrificans]|uniref:Phosphatidylserine/phosphatidylglycerophosphate/cardiolipin synthase n=1 Tax=Thiohalomonas denitrificans TaxID=415747 RepID=A0A1G5Q165_9GAMM|nr:VTT domain-containing protein [Thiohalomonas denitrificans]SCZ55594.1 Phosphatidylserine/phosphatidylglycerophosphate/cardiolipin synthase [Thiohalomonas denitrificans]